PTTGRSEGSDAPTGTVLSCDPRDCRISVRNQNDLSSDNVRNSCEGLWNYAQESVADVFEGRSWNKDDVIGHDAKVWLLTLENIFEINRQFLTPSFFIVTHQNPLVGFGCLDGTARLCQGLTDQEILFLRKLESSGPANLSNHIEDVDDPFRDIDDISSLNGNIKGEVSLHKELLEVNADCFRWCIASGLDRHFALQRGLVGSTVRQPSCHRYDINEVNLLSDLVLARFIDGPNDVDRL